MQQNKKIVSYVCHNNNVAEVKSIVSFLERELPVIGRYIPDIRDLFSLLADPTFHTDYITVYIEDFYTLENTNSFELIQTLDTLIKCTVYRPNNNNSKPIRRTTKIVAVVGDKTTVETIKDILEFDTIAFLTPGGGKNTSIDEVKEGVLNFIENKNEFLIALKNY